MNKRSRTESRDFFDYGSARLCIVGGNTLMSWYEEKHIPLNVTISTCENTGTIHTLRGGGIAGVFVSNIPEESGDRVSVTLEDNVNSADIHCLTDNSFIGGIAGNVGVPYGKIIVKNCCACGTIIFDDNGLSEGTTDEDSIRLELSRIGGGIIGMIHNGLFMTTNGDDATEDNINSADANIVITGCHSDMVFDAPDEDKYIYDDGAPVFLNRFGGIIGFSTGREGYRFRVENCTYTNCDRGLGVVELPDVGTKR